MTAFEEIIQKLAALHKVMELYSQIVNFSLGSRGQENILEIPKRYKKSKELRYWGTHIFTIWA